MEKQVYITEEERAKCQKVTDAFAELYEMEKIVVLDAGRYGFVELKYYKPPMALKKMQLLRTAEHCLMLFGRNGSIRHCI